MLDILLYFIFFNDQIFFYSYHFIYLIIFFTQNMIKENYLLNTSKLRHLVTLDKIIRRSNIKKKINQRQK